MTRPEDRSANPSEDPLLAAAWALDALDDDDRAAYEARLRSRPEERADAEALRETAARLGPAVAPPARLRAGILNAIADVEQEPRGTAAPVADLDVHRRRREGSRRGPSRWSVLVAAAGIVLAAVGVGVGVQRGEPTTISAQETARQEVADLMTTAGARVSTVPATGGGTATLVRAGNRIGVLTTGLPSAGAGRGYQLWLASGDALASAGMLPVTAQGGSATVVDAGSADAVGISVEPATGSLQPTTDPVVLTALGA